MKRKLSLSLLGISFLLCYLLLFPSTIDASSFDEDKDEQQYRQRNRNRNSQSSSRPRPSRRQRRQRYGDFDSGMGTDYSEQDGIHLTWNSTTANACFQHLTEKRHKPRDIVEGAAMAIHTLLVGGLASLTSFVGIPMASIAFLVKTKAKSNESMGDTGGFVIPAIIGMISGSFVGSIVSFAINLCSIFRAATSLWDGLLGTPKTLNSWVVKRQVWNPYERKWKERNQSLEDERRELLLLMEEQEQESARKRREMKVMDTKLYDLLEISPDASKSIIKKAYFSKAKDTHPDKNRDNPKAHELFVELHEAYSILSDDAKRSEYDRWGSRNSNGDGTAGANTIHVMPLTFDANLFVAILFSGKSGMSSPTVEQFVGDLGLATFIDSGYKMLSIIETTAIFLNQHQQEQTDNEIIFTDRILQFATDLFDGERNKNEMRRTARSIEVATNLVSKSIILSDQHYSNSKDTVCDSDTNTCSSHSDSSREENFRQVIREEARQILKDSGFYGPTYLEIIGSSLMSQIKLSQVLVPRGVRALYKKWATRNQFVHALYELCATLGPVVSEIENPTLDDFATAGLPNSLLLINIYNRVDISTAIEEAVWRVLNDSGASRRERRNRKRAIRIIGEEFTKLAADGKANNDNDSGDKRTVNELKANFVLAFKIASKQG